MTDYTNIPILRPKDCSQSQPTSELENKVTSRESRIKHCSPEENMSNEKEDRDVNDTQEVWLVCAKLSSAFCQCLQWRKSSPTFSQTPTLALCHCLICCWPVICRSKQLQPVCVCGGGEWEERPDQAFAGSQHSPLLSQDTPPIPLFSNEGSPLSGKKIPSSAFNVGK